MEWPHWARVLAERYEAWRLVRRLRRTWSRSRCNPYRSRRWLRRQSSPRRHHMCRRTRCRTCLGNTGRTAPGGVPVEQEAASAALEVGNRYSACHNRCNLWRGRSEYTMRLRRHRCRCRRRRICMCFHTLAGTEFLAAAVGGWERSVGHNRCSQWRRRSDYTLRLRRHHCRCRRRGGRREPHLRWLPRRVPIAGCPPQLRCLSNNITTRPPDKRSHTHTGRDRDGKAKNRGPTRCTPNGTCSVTECLSRGVLHNSDAIIRHGRVGGRYWP